MKLTEENYIERDVSWMLFNRRILAEAQRQEIPLMERLNFLGIYSNNLDEFFRVRVATLNRIVDFADKNSKDLRARSKQALKTIGRLNAKYAQTFKETVKDVFNQLQKKHIHLLSEQDLDDSQKEAVKEYCLSKLAGNLSPIWLSSVQGVNSLSDDSIHFVVRLKKQDEQKKGSRKGYAIIEIPVKKFGRFVQLPDVSSGNVTDHYVMYLDDVIRCALPYLFPGSGFTRFEAWSFKFTKDAEMELDTNIQGGTLQKIAKGVRSRKNGLPIRFIYDEKMPREVLKKLLEQLKLSSVDASLPSGRHQNHKDLMKFPRFEAPRGTKFEYPKWPSVMPAWAMAPTLLDVIREKDRFIHVPYHSFDAYINLLREAAINPEVKGIKTTLYRLARDSKVIGSLIAAARNGKKVTVVIELLARFDEESNIDWCKKMADAGIHVIMGVEGLKIHSKVTLITAKKGNLACISTGNFHEGNACAYTDFLQFTARQPIVKDVERLFDFIEKPYMSVKFKELVVSPNDMRRQLIRLINQEIRNHNLGYPAYILCKLNHVTDESMVKKIYEAASAGVKVDLLVRGNCSLVPSLPELGGNLRVNAIIDRYLEHSRILIFANGVDLEHLGVGEEDGSYHDYKVFIGSADWMPRNLDHRIEVYSPVFDIDIKREARLVVEQGMRNNYNSFRSQAELYKHYKAVEK